MSTKNKMSRETIDTIVERINGLVEKMNTIAYDQRDIKKFIMESSATKNEIRDLEVRMDEKLKSLEDRTEDSMRPIRTFITGAVSFILLSVLGAVLSYVLVAKKW